MPISALDVRTAKLITTTQIITSVYAVVKELMENALDADADNIEINLVCVTYTEINPAYLFIICFYKEDAVIYKDFLCLPR